jgi:hypothetical protein
MARNPYHLQPDVIDLMGTALRTAELFKLDSATERLLRDSAMLSDQHIKALEQLTKPLELAASFRWDYSAQFAHIQTALDGLARVADIGNMNGFAKMQAAQDSWLEQTRFIQDTIERSRGMFGSTAESLARLATSFELGAALGLERYRHVLDSGMRSLADSAASIYEADQQTLISLPRLAIERPPQELFVHVSSVEVITSTDTDEGQAEAPDDDSESLLPLLESLGPVFLEKWTGARQALASRNPDRIAHVSVSVRELFRMVLHHVAPDDEIRAWSQSKNDFEKGRPTRAARFRFATRSVSHPPFASFLAKDFSAALELLTLFDRGVHESTHSLTERQVRLMTLRMNQFLRFLLETARESDS